MQHTWKLRKLDTLPGEPVGYRDRDGRLDFNALVGQSLRLAHTGGIFCRVCDKRIPKAYGEGYCYPHFQSDPANAPCIVRPELCEAHLGRGRDPAWEQAHHNREHVVYLAVSGGLKVGVTRADNTLARWIDQGASRAIVLARLPWRALAGELEVALKAHLSDRTSWQRMLKNEDDPAIDLAAEKARVAALVPAPLAQWISADEAVTELHYPVTAWPAKVRSVSLDKTPEFEGRLSGIRGQYLMFEDGAVFNVRRHTGYEVRLSA